MLKFAGFVCLIAACGATSRAEVNIAYQTTDDWGAAFNAQITIYNNSNDTLKDWKLEFDFDPLVQQMWDGKVASHIGSHYVVISAGWNNTIAANQSVVIGFLGSPGGVAAGAANFNFTSTLAPEADPAPVVINVSAATVSGGRFTAAMVINNAGAEALGSWTLDFTCDQTIDSISNAVWKRAPPGYTISGDGIPAAGRVSLQLAGQGALTWNSFGDCAFNDSPCQIVVSPASGTSSAPAIMIDGVDRDAPALQITIPQSTSTFHLSLSPQASGSYAVSVNNQDVIRAEIAPDETLRVSGIREGRAGLRIEETASGATRFLGVRVSGAGGSLPGLPRYLSLGSVSEDTDEDLKFWESFLPGPMGKRVDMRYIYLNGGPVNGWDTWSPIPGGRATTYIRNSRMLGIIPFFVFYNIADGSEGYLSDLAHVQDASYMEAYFKNLKLALDIIDQEAGDDLVGLLLEPDFLGYLAQSANQPAAAIPAATRSAYTSGVLISGVDSVFPDSVSGLVQAINYTIAKHASHVFFGWQMNLWASPPGGWTTPVPAKGLIHKTDGLGVVTGRPLIYNEAAAITKYYLDAGIASYGANFVAIDKYGLDATGFESSAAANPQDSTWFWNNDHWQNYLAFASAMHDTSKLPVILWQLPAGHINGSLRPDVYSDTGLFPDLTDSYRAYEDSASTFLFGDTFRATGARYAFFSKNDGSDSKLSTDGATITWGSHLDDAAAAGVIAVLCGAGVGASTTNLGAPPTDSYWWITAAQHYYAGLVP